MAQKVVHGDGSSDSHNRCLHRVYNRQFQDIHCMRGYATRKLHSAFRRSDVTSYVLQEQFCVCVCVCFIEFAIFESACGVSL
jgi:hypothetical protein